MAPLDPTAMPTGETIEHVEEDSSDSHFHLHNLGHVRLRNEHTNEIILIPAPSLDPNDPLRW